jgi:uncharacterized membrane protein (UPF0182 family)
MTNNIAPQRNSSPAAIATIIVIVLGVAALGLLSVYTDLLWFGQLGFDTVFTTQIVAQGAVFALGAIVMSLFTWLGFFIAYKNRPIYLKFTDERDPFAGYRMLLDQLRKVIMIGLPTILGVLGGVAAASQWKLVLTWLNRTETGEVDPQFGLDVSFYLFDLPFFTAAVGYLSAALLLSGLIAAAVHMIYGGIRFNGRETKVGKAARVQIAITAALYLLVQGLSLWLDQYVTMTSSAGLYTGATYSDVNAVIPGFQILALISVVVAALFLITAVMGQWRISIMGTALMVVSSLVLGGLYPWIVQTFQVVPNERTLEAEYIKRNIAATRTAYGLDQVEATEYKATTDATAGALRKDAETTANIRIIDPALVSASFRQLEQYKQYYSFASHLDVDRYTIDGKTQDTVLAVRELQQSGLGDSQSWYNNVIVYTHGYGVVAAYGNQRSSEGQPVFLQKGIPSNGLLGEYEPRIYFGENSPAYSIVGAKAGSEPRELDYPAGDGEADQTYTTFNGNGGPKLDNIAARLAYAIKFQSEQILLSDAISNDSQILYNRDPRSRVAAVAPYLTLDSDSYPAIVDGRVVWIVDGYTTSNNYPYSRSENLSNAIADSGTTDTFARGSVNYIRNSVKATVDAYDGTVTLYQWDEKDPVLKTWMKAFPGTVTPKDKISANLLDHIRYPEDLFRVQRDVLSSYHVKTANAFYGGQDFWRVPRDPSTFGANASAQPPYYLTLQMPGSKTPAFSLTTPFVPRGGRENLSAFAVANSTAGPDYGKITVLQLPRSTNVAGPSQVASNFEAKPEVANSLSLLRQGGSDVVLGNLLTLPVGNGLLYVQPVYVRATSNAAAYPLLQKVLVSFGDQIGFDDTLKGALDQVFGGNSGTQAGGGNVEAGGSSSDASSAIASAIAAYKDGLAALAKGDFAAYDRAQKRLKSALDAAANAQKK